MEAQSVQTITSVHVLYDPIFRLVRIHRSWMVSHASPSFPIHAYREQVEPLHREGANTVGKQHSSFLHSRARSIVFTPSNI